MVAMLLAMLSFIILFFLVFVRYLPFALHTYIDVGIFHCNEMNIADWFVYVLFMAMVVSNDYTYQTDSPKESRSYNDFAMNCNDLGLSVEDDVGEEIIMRSILHRSPNKVERWRDRLVKVRLILIEEYPVKKTR